MRTYSHVFSRFSIFRSFIKRWLRSSVQRWMHHLQRYAFACASCHICSEANLSRFHCPTLTRRALIILTLFCKAKPSPAVRLFSDAFSVTTVDFLFVERVIYAEKRDAVLTHRYFFAPSFYKPDSVPPTKTAFSICLSSNIRISNITGIVIPLKHTITIWTIAEQFLKKAFQEETKL